MTLTWFGWLYLIAQALSGMWLITQIGERRDPYTPASVIAVFITTGLAIWGQIAVGMVTR